MRLASLVITASLLLSSLPVSAGAPENADQIVKDADWKAMQTVSVDIREFEYGPDEVRFKAGQPYKLVLRNAGEKKHYFTAPEFYQAIATRKVEAGKAEIKAPYFKAFELLPGGELELFFVAVDKGEYDVYCTIEDHRDQGMEGVLVIE